MDDVRYLFPPSFLFHTEPLTISTLCAVPKDKVKERLEQLDQFEEDENDTVETVTMTQKDFIKIIEKFHKNLQTAWAAEQRRDALRIAIKVRIKAFSGLNQTESDSSFRVNCVTIC